MGGECGQEDWPPEALVPGLWLCPPELSFPCQVNLKQLLRSGKISLGNLLWPFTGSVPVFQSNRDYLKGVCSFEFQNKHGGSGACFWLFWFIWQRMGSKNSQDPEKKACKNQNGEMHLLSLWICRLSEPESAKAKRLFPPLFLGSLALPTCPRQIIKQVRHPGRKRKCVYYAS